ncbi:TIGR01777 family oxidoreductase [Pseudohongiella spirulinae]|uniref:Cell division inhibitor n=1 Tax=Pseudohongiella spirulinae TaxID=1249552 RepID=A0A0S2KEI1_9GAMM|nr:TIGR01777 family oxidoreductase [Pseudohongiella spirulinae]ALO46731.1 Cell division inhibitor [Pseudohongiella spirulinae]
MNILITGGTGFIGRPLVRLLLEQGHQVTVLVRDYASARLKLGVGAELLRSLDELPVSARIDCAINLAGAGIADKRWTLKRKQVLKESRLATTRQLVQLFQRLETPPACLLSASAIGYYGAGRKEPLTENDIGISEFSHDLCRLWEAEARKAESLGIRVCLMRFGVVLGAGGGMLARLLPFYRMWLGGRLGNGQQMMSWVHRDDVLSAMLFLMHQSELSGEFNVTAPNAVNNEQFNDTLAALLRRPALFNQPAFLVQLMFGEMGDRLLLNGQHVVPERLLHAGFSFRYSDLQPALQACLCDSGLN